MKNFYLALAACVFAVGGVVAQGYSGQPNVVINGSHNVTIPCGNGGGCFNASASQTADGYTTSYAVDSIQYVTFPTTGTPVSANTDDVWSSVVHLPFNFCFFGNTYGALLIGSNGILTFDTTNAGLYCPWQLNGVGGTANPIPNGILPTNSIMGPYQDIDPLLGGTINYTIIGQAPRRIFVVSFNQVPQFSCTNLSSTGQIALYEGTNYIDVYISNKALCTTWNLGHAIEGIQNSAASLAYVVPNRNNTQWTVNNDAWRFRPNGQSNVSVKWHRNQDTTTISATDSAILCPPSNATTLYIVDVTYAQCDTALKVVSDTLSLSVTQSAGPDQYLSCPSALDSVVMAGTGSGTWTAVPGNPSATVIASPNSPSTSISGFGPLGTYYFAWSSVLCTDTAAVIVSSHPNAGPDVFTCVNGTATMAGIGTGIWTQMAGNPRSVTINTPTSPVTTISGFTVGGTYNFIWNYATCTDTASVIVPNFAISARGDTSLCKYLTSTLSVTAGPQSLAPFSYLWIDSSLVQSPTSATTVIKPIQNTTHFQIRVTSASGCVLIDTVTVTLSGVAPRISITPSNNNVCPGDTISLNSTVLVANLVSCGLVDTCPDNSLLSSQAVGIGGANTAVETPYSGTYPSAKTQYLFTAAELNAAGISSGAITDISFFVTQVNSTVGYDSFTVSMGCTNQDSLTGFVNTLMEVAPPVQVYPNQGWSPHPFSHFYNWDGVSNIVVQVCYMLTGASTNSDNVAYSTTSYSGSVAYARSFASVNGCSLNGATLSANRPNVKFGMCAPNILSYSWTPATLLCDTCAATQVVVNKDTTYTLVVNDNGCVNDSNVRVTINPYLAVNAAPDTTLCNHDTVQLSVTLTNPPSGVCLQNYFVSSIPYAAIVGNAVTVPSTSYLDATGTNSTDDGVSGPLNIGFNMPFYCETFSHFWVSTNGWISFVNPYPATVGAQQFTAQTYPPSAADLNPQKIISLMFGDYNLAPNGAGTVSYFLTGGAPNRILVVKFNGIQRYANAGTTTSGELHLHEGSGIIDIMLQSSNYGNSAHTTGIKDSTGLGLAAPGRNNTPYTISTPEGWRFIPQNGPSVVISGAVWSPNVGLSNDSVTNPYAYPSTPQTYVANTSVLINQFTAPEICHVRDSVVVRIGNFPHTLTAAPQTICAGTTSQLSFNTNDVVTSYAWTPSVPLSSTTIKNPVATINNTTTFYVTAVDSSRCGIRDSITVFTYPALHPNIGRDTTICYTDSVHLGLSGSFTSYQWYSVNPVSGQTIPVATTSGLTVFPSGYYVLRVQDSASACFYNSDTVHVDSFAHSVLQVIASGPLGFCPGGNVVLQTQQGYFNYNWTPAGGSTQAVPVTTMGNYSYTATDAHNCARFSDTAHVIVSNPPSITLNQFKNPICTTDTDRIIATTVPAGIPVSWTLNGVQVATGDTFVTSTPGSYQVYASQGCPDSIPLVIAGAVSPTASLGQPITTCNCHPSIVLDPTVTPSSAVSYAWSTGTTDSIYTVDSIGHHVYTVTVTDVNHCTATASLAVNVNCLSLNAFATPDTVYVNEQFLLTADSTGLTGISYHWYPDSTLGSPTYGSTKGTPLGQQALDTFYLAAIDNATQCTDTVPVVINVINHGGFRMATAFTPNSDGKNDKFYPIVALGSKVSTFRIYNRWGQLVWDNPDNGWDGGYGGKPQATDTYIYFVTVESPDPLDAAKKIQTSAEGSFQLFR